MATIAQTGTFAPVLARVETALAEQRAAFAQWRLYRQTLAELRGLDARDLADLGLAPGGLKAVAREAVYGAAG